MKATVKNTYVVYFGDKRFKGGEEIPPSLISEVLKTQEWKIQVTEDVKKEKETSSGEGADKEREEEKEIKDITVNRMMDEKHTKKRG